MDFDLLFQTLGGKKKRIYGIAKTMFEFEDQKLQSSAKYFWKNTFRVKTIVPLLTLSETWLRIGSLPCLNSANIYLFELKNRNTRERCEICPEFNNDVILVFFFKFEHISQLFLVFLVLSLNK